ncbi:MAG: toll/interleukin-1 receptor domain-containing protein, partial [Abitibacteriaceae bacterium]|nr:toll/interleukin-1 receptor domain-containing protein [Abditibacteriaceae bacterium]
NSDIVLACLTTESVNKKGYVQKEIRFALDVADQQPEDTIYLIPVKLKECGIPERLRKWQWVELFQENGYQRLIKALRRRLITLDGHE